MDLVQNVTENLAIPNDVNKEAVRQVQGKYLYYHYDCDGHDDRGWGCGYRTLQTLCSWIYFQRKSMNQKPPEVPSLKQIQECLVNMQDKPSRFLGSREWIGSIEVGLVVDCMYDVPCKIIHISNGKYLKNHVEDLEDHFKSIGSPIMMGGDNDAASKGVFGVCRGNKTDYLLILDPHYYGPKPSTSTLIENNMLLWRTVDSFMENSFYNLCLPQFTKI